MRRFEGACAKILIFKHAHLHHTFGFPKVERMKFIEIGLSEPLLKAITEMGYETPTPIQEQGIPLLLQGEDLVGQAQTGTGKTAAFGLPILEKWLNTKPEHKPPFRRGCATPSALILAPTRELAIQVANEMRKMGKYTGVNVVPLYGGQEIEKQTREFGRPVDIVAGTPGRILDHLERGSLDVSRARSLVLDEADRMLDMGFMDDVVDIIRKTPKERQTMMFSATMPREIMGVAYEYMKAPQTVKVGEDKITLDKIRQYYIEVPDARMRLPLLLGLIKAKNPQLAIIFCRTKMGADKLGHILKNRGIDAMALHGDMTQRQRDNAMGLFREGKIHALVATDLASRGLDVFDVSHVINYDLPEEHTTYVHRIGRTGRMGAEGEAVSFIFTDQLGWLEELEKMTNVKVEKLDIAPDADMGRPAGHGSGPHEYGDRRPSFGRGGRFGEGRRSFGGSHERREGAGGKSFGSERRGGFGGRREGSAGRGGSFGGEEGGRGGFGGGVSGQTMRKIKERPLKQAEPHRQTRHGHTYTGRQA